MKLHHTQPCAECPWRLRAPAGWLGGHPAEYYADAVSENETPACHLRDHGPANPTTGYCAGALACASNACILPESADEREARAEVGRREDVFSHPRHFYLHHTGHQYTQPLLRRLALAQDYGEE